MGNGTSGQWPGKVALFNPQGSTLLVSIERRPVPRAENTNEWENMSLPNLRNEKVLPCTDPQRWENMLLDWTPEVGLAEQKGD